MKLKSKLMMFTAALALSTTMAFAAITSNDIVTSYQAEAYTYIKIKEGPTQIKVEAIKDGVKVEVTYDKATGAVLKKESGAANANEAARTGVFVRQVGDDFEGETSGHSDGIDDEGIDGDDGNDDVDSTEVEDNESHESNSHENESEDLDSESEDHDSENNNG